MLARRGCRGAFGASSKQAPAGGNVRVVRCPAFFGPSSTDRLVVQIQQDMQKSQAQLEQVLTIQHEMQKSQAQLVTDVSKIKEDVTQLKLDSAQQKLDSAQLKVDVTQLKLDNAVNRALVAANFFPAAALVLGVLYFVYSNFRISNV